MYESNVGRAPLNNSPITFILFQEMAREGPSRAIFPSTNAFRDVQCDWIICIHALYGFQEIIGTQRKIPVLLIKYWYFLKKYRYFSGNTGIFYRNTGIFQEIPVFLRKYRYSDMQIWGINTGIFLLKYRYFNGK